MVRTFRIARGSTVIAMLVVLNAPGSIPTFPPQGPTPGSVLTHRPWWHTRGHLSDYHSCQPCAEDGEATLVLETLAVDGQHYSDRARKPAQYRDEFLNIVNEVPELAAVFLPEDMQSKIMPPSRQGRASLGLHASSLLPYFRTLLRDRTPLHLLWHRYVSGAGEEGLPEDALTSIGYQVQRKWLDVAYGDLGGARGCSRARRSIMDTDWPDPVLPEDPDEPSHFFLPDALCEEIGLDPSERPEGMISGKAEDEQGYLRPAHESGGKEPPEHSREWDELPDDARQPTDKAGLKQKEKKGKGSSRKGRKKASSAVASS